MAIGRILVFTMMLSAVSVYASNEGANLFKKCAICHGVNAQKKSLGVSEIIAGWPADKIVHKLKGYKAKEIDTYGFGKMMQGQATKLNDSQMKIVAKFVEGLKPEVVNHMKEKRLSTEDKKYNDFIKEYFKKNRNGTTQEAKIAWKKYLLEAKK